MEVQHIKSEMEAKPEIGSQGLARSMLQERQKGVHPDLRCGVFSVPSQSSQTGLLRSEGGNVS